MIYFTKHALSILRKKLFYVKLEDDCKGIIYDKSGEQSARKELNENKQLPKCSIYLLVDRIKRTVEKDVYWFGAKDKIGLEKQFFEVLERENLNALYFTVKNKKCLLILSDADIEKEKYRDAKTDDSEWPKATARDDFKTTVLLTSKVVKQKRKITDLIEQGVFTDITVDSRIKTADESLSQSSDHEDDLREMVDLLKMDSDAKLEDYKPGEKVKIYNSDNPRQFVEIIWPDNPVVENLMLLVQKQIKDEKIKQVLGDDQ